MNEDDTYRAKVHALQALRVALKEAYDCGLLNDMVHEYPVSLKPGSVAAFRAAIHDYEVPQP